MDLCTRYRDSLNTRRGIKHRRTRGLEDGSMCRRTRRPRRYRTRNCYRRERETCRITASHPVTLPCRHNNDITCTGTQRMTRTLRRCTRYVNNGNGHTGTYGCGHADCLYTTGRTVLRDRKRNGTRASTRCTSLGPRSSAPTRRNGFLTTGGRGRRASHYCRRAHRRYYRYDADRSPRKSRRGIRRYVRNTRRRPGRGQRARITTTPGRKITRRRRLRRQRHRAPCRRMYKKRLRRLLATPGPGKRPAVCTGTRRECTGDGTGASRRTLLRRFSHARVITYARMIYRRRNGTLPRDVARITTGPDNEARRPCTHHNYDARLPGRRNVCVLRNGNTRLPRRNERARRRRGTRLLATTRNSTTAR